MNIKIKVEWYSEKGYETRICGYKFKFRIQPTAITITNSV